MDKTTRTASCIAALVMLLAAAQVAAAEDEAALPEEGIMRQITSEPGHLEYSQDNAFFNEHIETSNGQLSISHEELSIPLNGGRSLSVTRSYNSHSDFTRSPETSRAGLGWTMHMGRVIFPAKYQYRLCYPTSAHMTNQFDNPVIELPDGARKMFYLDRNDETRFITADNWKLECMPASETVYVMSPDGTRYDMDVAYVFDSAKAGYLYPSLITDRHGNVTQIDYASSFDSNGYVLSRIAAEDLSIDFIYNPETRNLEEMRTSDGRVWQYTHTEAGVGSHAYLTRVDGPGDYVWEYEYFLEEEFPNGRRYNLSRLVTPGGASIAYDYALTHFNSFDNPVSVVSRRDLSGNVEGGAWIYTYERYAEADETTANGEAALIWMNKTTITGPSHEEAHYHISDRGEYVSSGARFSPHPLVQRVKLKETRNGEVREYRYQFRVISNEQFGIVNYLGQFLGASDEIVAPLLVYSRHERNGRSAAIFYTEHDQYGNPGKIAEFASIGFPDEYPPVPDVRITTLTYSHLTDKWILALKSSEVTGGAHSISREFDASGNLLSETVDGVTTSFTYHQSGDLASQTDALGNTTSYGDYYRGQARRVEFADGAAIALEIDRRGNVTKRIDEAGRVTSYAYDDLGRLTLLQPPAGHATDITHGFDETMLTRGAYRETVGKDGFGRVLRVLKQDTLGNHDIEYKVDRDAYGRVVHEYFPNSDEGKSFTYDALGRLLSTSVNGLLLSQYEYTADGVRHTDGNGNVTLTAFNHFGSLDGPGQVYQLDNAKGRTVIVHNLAGNVLRVYQGNAESGSISRSFEYDYRHNLRSVSSPEAGYVTYDHDLLGNLLGIEKENGAGLSNRYDSRHRLVESTDLVTNETTVYDYFPDGRVRNESRGDVSVAYTYEQDGLLGSMTVHFSPYRSFRFDYSYDDDRNLAVLTYPGGNSIEYGYDAFRRVRSVSPYVDQATYYPSGNKQSVIYANGRQIDYREDGLRRLFEMQTQAGNLGVHFRYAYDANQNLSEIQDLLDPANSLYMIYDEVDRLLSVTEATGETRYDYDPHNNISAVYRDAILEKAYSYTGQHLRTLEHASGRQLAFEYDAAGMATYIGDLDHSMALSPGERVRIGSKLTYDSFGNLTSYKYRYGTVDGIPGGSPSFAYTEEVAGPEFIYTPSNLLALEKYGPSRTYNLYSREGDLLMTEKDGIVIEHIYFDGDVVATREFDCLSRALDSDGDSVPDCEEREQGMDPENRDTDGDSLEDGEELAIGTNPLVDDSLADDDNDGLTNLFEITLGTDFRLSDTDGDGVNDGEEHAWNTSPLDPLETPELRFAGGFSLEGRILDTPAVDAAGNLYLVMEETDIAIKGVAASGDILWSWALPQTDCLSPARPHVYGPVIDSSSGRLMVSVCGNIHVLSLGTGQELWSYAMTSGTGWQWSKIVSLGDKTAVAVHDGFGMHGRLLMFDRDGVLSWTQPLDDVRSLVSDGSLLFTASCGTGMVSVSAHALDGEKQWETELEAVPCGNESINDIPLSLGLVGELYLLHGHQAVVLNRDGTMHSIVRGDFASQASNNIVVGTQGKVLLQGSSGDIFSISEIDGLEPYVTDFTADIMNGAMAWLADGSLLSVSHQFLARSQGYQSMYQLVRISPDGKVMERLEQGYADRYLYNESTVPLMHASGFYFVMQQKSGIEVIDIALPPRLQSNGVIAPWPMRDGNVARSGTSMSCGMADNDSDAMPDCYESIAGLDASRALDATEDADSDGLTNLREYILGTHPFMKDSDGDSIPDGIEDSLSLDALSSNTRIDSDADGVFDTLEVLAGFSPVNPDSRPTGGERVWQRPVAATHLTSPLVGNRHNVGIFTSGSKLFDQHGKQLSSREIDADVIWLDRARSYYIDPTGDLRYLQAEQDLDSPQSGLLGVMGAALSKRAKFPVNYYVSSSGSLMASQDIPFETQHNWTIDIPRVYPSWEGTPVTGTGVHAAPVLNGGKHVSATAGNLFLQAEHGSDGQVVAGELLDGEVRTAMAADRFGTLVMGTDAGSVYAINNGDVQWKNSWNAPLSSGVAVGYGGVAYAGDDQGVLRAIGRDGVTLWWNDYGDAISGTPLLGASGNLYFFAGSDLVAVDTLGYEIWRTNVSPAPSTSARMDENGLLYLTSTTSGLTAIYTGEPGAARSDWPMEAHDGGASGNLNGGLINDDRAAVIGITSPAEGDIIATDSEVKLVATAYDEEDGNLSDLIEWWRTNDPVEQLGLGRKLSLVLPPGDHRIAAFVRDSGRNLSNDAVTVTVSGEPGGLEFFTDVGSPAIAGQEIYLTADIENLDQYEYKFRMKKIGDEKFTRLQAFSEIPVFILDTSGMNGQYVLQVVARNRTDMTEIHRKAIRYWVNLPSPVTALDVDFPGGRVLQEGDELSLAASAMSSGTADYEYRFEIRQVGADAWEMLRDYSLESSILTLQPVGQYRLRIKARRAGSEDKPVTVRRTFWVNTPYALDTIRLDATRTDNGMLSRASYLIEAEAWNSSPDWNSAGFAVEYQFRIRFPGEERYRLIRDYSQVGYMEFIVPNGTDSGYADLLVKARVAGTQDKPVRFVESIYVFDWSPGIGLFEGMGELN